MKPLPIVPLLLALIFGAGPALAGEADRIPPPDCSAHVGYDRDLDLPGYLIASVCIPFTVTAARPPAGYRGDFYVDEFSDAKLRERWAACKTEPACFDRLSRHIARRQPPNREHGLTDPHVLYLLGKIDADNSEADLKAIRRPVFFAAAPYQEDIAEAEGRTFTVEFTALADPYDRLIKGLGGDVKLRGWYLQGEGVDDGAGHKVRALLILSNGGGGRLVAIDDPADRLYAIDPATGNSVLNSFPNATSGASGQRGWRHYLAAFNKAGFDVLSYDRRGVGLSGGYADTNTLQQGRDILKVAADLRTGEGLRLVTPAGVELRGGEAAKALSADVPADRLPILLGGSSRGTMATAWAMTRNFDKRCDYDLGTTGCDPPERLSNIKGAIMLADFTAGAGYVTAPTEQQDADRGLFTAGSEELSHIVFFPGSGPLAGVNKWPALFIGRGLWDYAESLEGAVDAYDRVKGLKEMAVVRGPHPFETWPEAEQKRVGDRMIAFGRAAVLGRSSVPGGRRWSTLKELVATASDEWEPSSRPKVPAAR